MMSNKLDNFFEIVCEGWLTKSPPTTLIWRSRWRKRWFILRHSGELPGQYFLCYYTDRNCRKLKGQIDLDQCEQVDAGLRFESRESRKQKYQHMFTIRTPKRIYYLAAESEDDMNKWVDCVCHVCGLKPFISDDTVTEYDGDDISETTTGLTELSPPVTPSTIITGPYIPISECISGKPINNAEDLKEFLLMHGNNKTATVVSAAATFTSSDYRPDSYDLPRNLRPPGITVDVGSTPSPSPGSESVFTDDESIQKPSVNWETFPLRSDSSADDDESPDNTETLKADRKFAKVVTTQQQQPPPPLAPPRPPKPSHLLVGETQPETNAEEATTATSKTSEPTQDEMYDIPRSHQKVLAGRHCYTNAAPGQVTDTNIFRYDFTEMLESPESETGSVTYSNTLAYSNLPSPSNSTGNQSVPTPPAVNRELKPGRKYSDSTGGSNEPSPVLLPSYPPNIDRKLKPAQMKKIQDALRSNDNTRNRQQHKSKKFSEIQYLDLDLDSTDTVTGTGLVKKSSENLHTPATATVYKTVDFLKTEAFNRTRIEVEEERSRLCMAAESAL